MARSSLFEAAVRLDRVIRDVKEKQFGAIGSGLIPVEPPPALHPEEAWARRFASHSMGPKRAEGARAPLSSFVVPPVDMPRMPVFVESPYPAALDGATQTGHIGSALGKAGPRRSWVGRLFRGRGI